MTARLQPFICAAVEFLLMSAAVLLSAVMRLSAERSAVETALSYIPHALLIALLCQLCMYYAELYDFRIALSHSQLFIRFLESLAAATIVLALLFYLIQSFIVGRGVLLLGLLLSFGLVIGWRLLYRWLLSSQQFRVNLLIIGTTEEARKLVGEVMSKPHLGYEIRGIIGESNEVGRDIL
jgi:FlaA1/EpsC-like NDP-sugar epimerase